MAACPRCDASLGLRTSFALANFWTMRGVPPFAYRPKLEFRCHHCGRILTYRYELAGVFAVLAFVPFMAWSALPSLNLGSWTFLLWPVAGLLYLAALAGLFSYFARPIPANPSIEDDQ
jgi:hypothetical protein